MRLLIFVGPWEFALTVTLALPLYKSFDATTPLTTRYTAYPPPPLPTFQESPLSDSGC